MPMNVILLERVPKLGQMGDVVKVKPGFARNFLLPQKKALRATKDNITYFESQRKTLEAQNLERRSEAEAVGAKMSDLKVTLIRQASEALQLYGSVTSRDIADGAATEGVKLSAARSSSTSRSRRWARTRSRCTSIRRSRSRSPRSSPVRPTRPSSSPRAARWSQKPNVRRWKRRKPLAAPPSRLLRCSKPRLPKPPKAKLPRLRPRPRKRRPTRSSPRAPGTVHLFERMPSHRDGMRVFFLWRRMIKVLS